MHLFYRILFDFLCICFHFILENIIQLSPSVGHLILYLINYIRVFEHERARLLEVGRIDD